MRDINRIPRIMAKLQKLWAIVPDWRLCQLISNLHGSGPQDIFHTEDEELEKGIDAMYEEYSKGT